MFGNIGGQHTILEDDNPVLLKAVKFLVPLVEKYANDELSLAELRDLKTDKLAMYKKEATANKATPSDTVVNRTRNVVVKQEKRFLSKRRHRQRTHNRNVKQRSRLHTTSYRMHKHCRPRNALQLKKSGLQHQVQRAASRHQRRNCSRRAGSRPLFVRRPPQALEPANIMR